MQQSNGRNEVVNKKINKEVNEVNDEVMDIRMAHSRHMKAAMNAYVWYLITKSKILDTEDPVQLNAIIAELDVPHLLEADHVRQLLMTILSCSGSDMIQVDRFVKRSHVSLPFKVSSDIAIEGRVKGRKIMASRIYLMDVNGYTNIDNIRVSLNERLEYDVVCDVYPIKLSIDIVILDELSGFGGDNERSRVLCHVKKTESKVKSVVVVDTGRNDDIETDDFLMPSTFHVAEDIEKPCVMHALVEAGTYVKYDDGKYVPSKQLTKSSWKINFMPGFLGSTCAQG